MTDTASPTLFYGRVADQPSRIALYGSELHPRLKCNHSWTAIATQTNAQQAGRRSSCVSERSKASLRGRLSRNTGQHHAWQPEVRVVEDIEKLTLKPQLHMLGQRKPFCQVKVAPEEIRTAQ